MRKLSFGEQALIGKLVANSADPTACFPIKALESSFQDNKVTFHNDEEPYFNFYVNEGKEESVKENSKRFISKLMEAFALVDYLKKEGLVMELESGKEKGITYGDDVAYVSAGLVEVRVYIEASLIAEQLVRFVNNSVYVTEALKELQANEFKTFEDNMLEEAKKQTKKTGKAVLFAFLAVIIAVAGNVLSSGVLGGKKTEGDCPMKQSMEAIQTSLEGKILPAITEVKTEVSGVKDAVNNLDAEPVSLNELKKDEQEEPKKEEPKKKSKKRKRK